MGWDAFAKVRRDELTIHDEVIRNDFKSASDEVKQLTGKFDWLLPHAGLDVSTCGEMLSRATNMNHYDMDGWSISKVKRLQERVNWDFDYDKGDEWAYESAKRFLELCAKHDLAIEFSW